MLGCCCSGAAIVPWFGAAACAGKVLSGGMELASGGCSVDWPLVLSVVGWVACCCRWASVVVSRAHNFA